MDITYNNMYTENVLKQLSVLEAMHDNFREQKNFCFSSILEEFKIEVGSTYSFINPFNVMLDNGKSYTIKSVTLDADEYVYIGCINNEELEISLEPYYLDAYHDYDSVFLAVYSHLRSECNGILPTDEFALSTLNYLQQECIWANENNVSLETFGNRMNAHTIDSSCDLFDFNIGAFLFTISKVNGKYIVNNSYEIYNGHGEFFSTDNVSSLKTRNGIQN